MISSRRAIQARHEFRFGTRELVIFGAALLLICALTFVFGLLVGREMVPSGAPTAKARAGSPNPSEPAPKATPGRVEQRLTFYKTLTAPTPDLPAVGQPAVEEHIVPREEPSVGADRKPAPTEGRAAPGSVARSEPPAPGRAASPGGAGGGGRPAVGARPPAVAAAAPVPPPAAVGTVGAEPLLWTVQVSSFRSRALAEELRARLVVRGFDAYLLSAATEEGRVRYRVRVGAFPTRTEAERVAAELRAERTLSPFVTPRSR